MNERAVFFRLIWWIAGRFISRVAAMSTFISLGFLYAQVGIFCTLRLKIVQSLKIGCSTLPSFRCLTGIFTVQEKAILMRDGGAKVCSSNIAGVMRGKNEPAGIRWPYGSLGNSHLSFSEVLRKKRTEYFFRPPFPTAPATDAISVMPI